MAIFKSTQSPLGWPLFSNFLNPFPHPFSPIAISPLFPISNYPFFPSPPQWQFQITITFVVGPNWPLSPPISPIAISPLFPISNLPILSHPTPRMAIFKSKLSGPIFNRPLFSNCPSFPLPEKITKKCVLYTGAQHIMQNQTQ
ncbi:uncharacterized protein Gasu_61120 [Galdieria sulphuraria]|uniref:Uncharacterized protein n=1 Tax=Galdieria sulphuraria TaxID=130081 RepID=M2XS46_GALSU|nr:uncharacterized protein Gasu_61120 [Galdieria sulphuraria]EME26244.1 hypothetical protein Gasu_61120 [Galdieria sulphuraria]|eukprot:XP_005702764.1 hypothetical protein Gasu_61120 [Galdieria sulphuraria]